MKPLLPVPDADDAQQRAERAMQAWLEEDSGGWNIVGCRVLRPPAADGGSAQGVFEFALTTRVAHPALEPRRIVAKCLDPETVAVTGQRHSAVHAAADALGGQLAVPRPLHVDAHSAVLLHTRTRGRCLADHTGNELPALLQGVERCGEALRELHEMPPQLLAAPGEMAARVSVATHLASLVRPAPSMLAEQCPPLRRRVVQVTQDLIGAEAACGLVAAVPLHCNLHPRQVFVAARCVEFVDWAQCGAGDAALDLANFMMHVDRRWPRQAGVLHEGLLRGWLAAGRAAPVRVPRREQALATRLHLYRAFHALRRACKAYGVERAALEDTAVAAASEVRLGASALQRISIWLEAAEQHLQACRRSAADDSLSAFTMRR
jgi:hypothetical protein